MSEGVPPAEPPPLPDVFEIPQETLDRWSGITSARPLLLSFGKHQLDNLMVSLRQGLLAQMALGDALQSVTNDDIPGAQAAFRRHQELSRYAYSNLNWFIQHVMTTAAPDGGENGR